MARPAQVKRLTAGQLIDTQEGFVDTFNYLVDFAENLIGEGETDKGKTLVVDRTFPESPVIRGGGEGGAGTPDGKSLDKITESGTEKLELKAFTTQSAEASTIAQAMTTATSDVSSRNVIERYNAVSGSESLGYRAFGSFVTGDDSNIVFTSASNGAVKVDIYYV